MWFYLAAGAPVARPRSPPGPLNQDGRPDGDEDEWTEDAVEPGHHPVDEEDRSQAHQSDADHHPDVDAPLRPRTRRRPDRFSLAFLGDEDPADDVEKETGE